MSALSLSDSLMVDYVLNLSFCDFSNHSIICVVSIYRRLIYIINIMRRGSLKKSSNFKIQAQKNIFKAYLQKIDNCKTVQLYPQLHEIIKSSSQAVYDNCYSFSDDSPFVKGLNYGCRNYGFSYQSATTVVYREWLPNIKEAYIFGQFNNFNEVSHPLENDEDEQDIFEIEIDTEKQKLNEGSKIMLRLVDKQGTEYKMCPPSCQAREGNYGIYAMDLSISKSSTSKKQQILLAYTLDLNEIPLEKAESWIEQKTKQLSDFNTIIIRNLFNLNQGLNRYRMEFENMKKFYDLVNTIKDKFGFKILIEWAFTQGYSNGPTNPIQKALLKYNPDTGLWLYNFEDQQVLGFYLSKISYYLATFQIDGYHFKEVGPLFNSETGQILLKFINMLHFRLLDNSFALASSKKQIPGLNQPILQGGLGFAFTYNFEQDFLSSESHKELKEKFDNILSTSNCVPIDLNKLNKKHMMNFIFAMLISQKGIFCRGNLDEYAELLKKLLRVRKQYELFSSPAQIIKITDKIIYMRRGHTHILFNFSSETICECIQGCEGKLQVLYSSGDQSIRITSTGIQLEGSCCSIIEEISE